MPDPAGQWWQSHFANPVTTDHITLVQPQRGDRSRWVSAVTLTFDGKNPIRYDLTPASHLVSGQTLTFPTQTFHTLRVTLDGTTDDTAPPLSAAAVGFAEVEIPGQVVHQVVQMPTQMLSTLGASSNADRLTVVMARQHTSQFPPRSDPETTISRQFTLPTARTFTLSGSASLSALIPDDEVDRLTGRAVTASTTLRDAYSSGRLPGDVAATATATADGNPATAWQPGLGTKAQIGSTLTYDLAKPEALSGLAMQVIADGRHSVPTAMTITSGSQVRQVDAPAYRGQQGARGRDDRAGVVPRVDRLALHHHLHRDPPRIRGQLLLGRSAGAAARHRGDRDPERAVGRHTGEPPRTLRGQPAHH